MGLFGPARKKGISDTEWEDKDKNRVRSAIGLHGQNAHRADEVTRAFEQALDADADTHGRRVMQSNEVDAILSAQEKAGRISHKQTEAVRKALEKDMRD